MPREYHHDSSDSETYTDSESVVEVGANPSTNTHEHMEVLDGVEIMPLAIKSSGKAEASQLGYSSKLVSNWYKHTCEYNSCPERWSEFDNVDDDEVDLKARNSAIPILHRFIYVKKHWVSHSITVQDPNLRLVLADVLKKYQDLDLEVENWTFEPPFMPLVHRWTNLKEYVAQAKTPALKNAAKVLLAFLTPVLATSVVSLARTRKTGKVNFDNVWQIFPPGSIVTTRHYGVETICRIVKYKLKPADRCAGTPPGWVIDMEYVDWNGERCGFTTSTLTIWHFEGHRRVTGLPVFPISFLSDEAGVRAAMIERGRKFERLRGYHFMIANGTKILLETEKPEQRPVSGKVCVDAYAYYRSLNKVKPKLRPLSGDDGDAEELVTDDSENSETAFESNFTAVAAETQSAAKGPAERTEDLTKLTEEQLLLTSAWLKGFDLKSKDWCELRVDELADMAWNDQAFDKLVLPGDEKTLAWAFVEAKSLASRRAEGEQFDDFIAEKGKGLIILMFGPPGVGKTFTAEAVAEKSRVPLYAMSAGDLGTAPADVERALARALELCRMWNAMLLLDEADVFLGGRSRAELARNELVSIFLRMLEYYQGILFLTTNRIASIDHAFQSRVDLFLPYHDLSAAARRQVWDNFIAKAGRDKFEVTDHAELDRLAELPLNGREIKNLIKSAQLLSIKSGAKVPMDRLYMLADKRVHALKVLDVSEE